MANKYIKRGQVWFYRPTVTPSGHIQKGARPVIIVSNDHLNRSSDVVLAVPCTSQIKRNFPTHVLFIMDNQVSVALTEQAGPINTDELVNCIYTLEEYIMNQVDEALKISLGLAPAITSKHTDSFTDSPRPVDKKSETRASKQVEKFYARYAKKEEPAKQQTVSYNPAPGKGKWTAGTMHQLVKDYESTVDLQSVADKYSLSVSTLKQYYRKFKVLI